MVFVYGLWCEKFKPCKRLNQRSATSESSNKAIMSGGCIGVSESNFRIEPENMSVEDGFLRSNANSKTHIVSFFRRTPSRFIWMLFGYLYFLIFSILRMWLGYAYRRRYLALRKDTWDRGDENFGVILLGVTRCARSFWNTRVQWSLFSPAGCLDRSERSRSFCARRFARGYLVRLRTRVVFRTKVHHIRIAMKGCTVWMIHDDTRSSASSAWCFQKKCLSSHASFAHGHESSQAS